MPTAINRLRQTVLVKADMNISLILSIQIRKKGIDSVCSFSLFNLLRHHHTFIQGLPVYNQVTLIYTRPALPTFVWVFLPKALYT